MNLRSNEGFNAYLDGSKGKHQAKTIRQYAGRFGHVLDSGNASDLLTLSPKNRLRAMAALAALSKYQGRYETWKQIKSAYGLKWKYQDDIQIFENITQSTDIDSMLDWVRRASKVAQAYSEILRYACLTGLRPAEVFVSISLPNEGYYNTENGALEHYRFPMLFIRQTKKAYVSIITPEILQIRQSLIGSDLSYNALRLTLQRHNIAMKMNYCRKINWTFLKKQGIDADIVDLLQGRLPKSVFIRHYFRPGFKHELDSLKGASSKLAKERSA